MSISEQLASMGGSQISQEMQKNGLVLAVVTNIEDPDTLGRIKCKPVTEDEDVAETDWCFCMTPAGGNEYGLFFFPNVDDLVILGYLGGNVHHPVVLGSYWAGDTAAPYAIESGKNEIISLKTPTGSEIQLDEAADAQKITITTPSGAVIKINDEEKTLTILGNDSNGLTLKWEDGELELKVDTKITLKAGDTSLTLESSGDITGTGSAKVSFEGADIALSGSTSFKAEGATADVKASGKMNLEASGNAVLKGAMVQIN